MLKRNITYKDYNGDEVTEVFYFNISESEIIELQVKYEGGLQHFMQRIVDANDERALVAEFKNLILLSYGVKSDDGKRFIKSDELREHFTQTAAYNALFMELATNDTAAATFINGITPTDVVIPTAPASTVITTQPPQFNPDTGGPIPIPPGPQELIGSAQVLQPPQ